MMLSDDFERPEARSRALFHWREGDETVQVECGHAGIRPGIRYRELWSGEQMQDEDGVLSWRAHGCDAVLLREI